MNVALHFRILTIGLALCGLPYVLQAQLGGVSGAVRDSVTGEPIEGVLIELLGNRNMVAMAMTDGAGRFTLSDVPAGRYGLVLTRINYRQKQLETVTVTLSVQNVLDNRHAEFIGTPEIGRLLLGRVRAEF